MRMAVFISVRVTAAVVQAVATDWVTAKLSIRMICPRQSSAVSWSVLLRPQIDKHCIVCGYKSIVLVVEIRVVVGVSYR